MSSVENNSQMQGNLTDNNAAISDEEFIKRKQNKKIEILKEAAINNDLTHKNNKEMLKKVAGYFNITEITELQGGGDVNNTNGTHDILGGSSKKTKRRRKKHRKSNKR